MKAAERSCRAASRLFPRRRCPRLRLPHLHRRHCRRRRQRPHLRRHRCLRHRCLRHRCLRHRRLRHYCLCCRPRPLCHRQNRHRPHHQRQLQRRALQSSRLLCYRHRSRPSRRPFVVPAGRQARHSLRPPQSPPCRRTVVPPNRARAVAAPLVESRQPWRSSCSPSCCGGANLRAAAVPEASTATSQLTVGQRWCDCAMVPGPPPPKPSRRFRNLLAASEVVSPSRSRISPAQLLVAASPSTPLAYLLKRCPCSPLPPRPTRRRRRD